MEKWNLETLKPSLASQKYGSCSQVSGKVSAVAIADSSLDGVKTGGMVIS